MQSEGAGTPTLLPVSDLLLDSENPRLPPSAAESSQADLLRIYDLDFDLLPIGQSMADNGYFKEEPLVAIPQADKFIVIEGNRRLAALKFLIEPSLRSLSHDSEAWENLSKSLKYDLTRVPVIVHRTRDELTPLLGFRHIAGVRKWDALAKARFINSLVEKKGKEANFSAIGGVTGSSRPTIRDNYIAYRIYLQARDRFGIDTSKLEADFSVFYRALSSVNIQEFIGLRKDRKPDELKAPIANKKSEALRELIEFVHGTANKNPVLTDSRQLTALGEVLASREALDVLRTSRNLTLASALTGGEERGLISNLQRADFYLGETLKYAHRHKQSIKVMEILERCAGTMLEILRSFPEIERKLRRD